MATTNLTSNSNLLSLGGFKLIINSHEFANTQFFVVSANLPGVTISEANASYKNSSGFVPGEKMMFDPLTLRIAMDEDFRSYMELFRWLKSFTDKKSPPKILDMTLVVLSSHNNANMNFTFVNAFPTALGSLEFNTQNSDVDYGYVDATFRFDYFKTDDLDFCL